MSLFESKVVEISAEQVQALLQQAVPFKLINVLAENVYKDCHIVRSINIPLDGLEEKVKDWDRGQKIVVYCARDTCSASKNAYHALKKLGFTDVHPYEGGTKEWKAKGLSVEGPCALDYLK